MNENIMQTSDRRSIGLVCDIMLDRYVRGVVRKLSHESPIPVLEDVSRTTFLGGGGNLLQSLSTLKTLFGTCAVVGCSEIDDEVLSLLTDANVDIEYFVRVPFRYVSLYEKFVGAPFAGKFSELVRVDDHFKGVLGNSIIRNILQSVHRLLDHAGIIVASGYLPPSQSCLQSEIRDFLVRECRSQKKILVCACRTDLVSFRGADYIVVNEVELLRNLGYDLTPRSMPELLQLSVEMGEEYADKGLVVTLGERGALIWVRSVRKSVHVPTSPLAPGTDPTGAGDVFLAVFASVLSFGKSPEEACEIAVNAATAALKSERRPALIPLTIRI